MVLSARHAADDGDMMRRLGRSASLLSCRRDAEAAQGAPFSRRRRISPTIFHRHAF